MHDVCWGLLIFCVAVYFVSDCSSAISAIFCMGFAYLFKAATVLVQKSAWRMLGILAILCRGA